MGYQFRRKFEPTAAGTYSVIQIRDFDESHNIIVKGLLRANLDKADQFSINKGDVLFLSRGHKNWAAAITADVENAVAVSHFFVIKVKRPVILPEYLAWYINQEPAQEYLWTNARHGTHMPLVPMSAFKELKIEVPAMETQKKIVELSILMEKEKKLMTELQGKRSLFINAICLNASKAKKEKSQ